MACRLLLGQMNLLHTRRSGQILLSRGANCLIAAVRGMGKISSRFQGEPRQHTTSSLLGPPRPKITITGTTPVPADAGTTRKSSGVTPSCKGVVLREIEHAKSGCAITSHPETLLASGHTNAAPQYSISRSLASAQILSLLRGIGRADRSYQAA
jgi:hypothetical protein